MKGSKIKMYNYYKRHIEEYSELQKRFIKNNVTALCRETSELEKCFVDCPKFMNCWSSLKSEENKK